MARVPFVDPGASSQAGSGPTRHPSPNFPVGVTIQPFTLADPDARAIQASGATLRVPMPFYLVQPWGRDRYRQATVQSIHDTVDDAYARLDAIAEKLQRDGAPPDYLELYVVDADRQPVTRPGVQ